jgi:hypothetical protein
MPGDKNDCLKLYSLWAKERKSKISDFIYHGMLEDSGISLKEALDNYYELNLKGAKVELNNIIRGFTFGFALNKETFCVLYEITDLGIKGLAQFISSKFAQELSGYKYINIMDDSGFSNLKKVKLSYHPKRMAPAYIVRKKHGFVTLLKGGLNREGRSG